MPVKFIMQKSDRIIQSTVPFTSCSTEVTKEIMTSFTTLATADTDKTLIGINRSMLKAIEKYNTDHHLPYEKRVHYVISTGGDLSVNVCYSYFITGLDACVVVVGFDQNGGVDFGFDQSKMQPNIIKANQALNTHIVALSAINDIQIGMYDDSKVNIFDNAVTAKDSTTYVKDLVSQLTNAQTELNGLLGSGKIRSYIIRFAIYMRTNGLNYADYSYNAEAYNIYTELWTKYIMTVQEILNEKDRSLRDETMRKYKFFATDAELLAYTKGDENLHERAWTDAEITEYREIVK